MEEGVVNGNGGVGGRKNDTGMARYSGVRAPSPLWLKECVTQAGGRWVLEARLQRPHGGADVLLSAGSRGVLSREVS